MSINIDDLQIVNYCHQNCIPLKNIVRLSEQEAFLLASRLSRENPETTAFYRFTDFSNYYNLRMRQDAYLYKLFSSLGGKPQEIHPLSFVLQGSELLNNWFGEGTIAKILLKNIPDEYISFTLGDSGAIFQRNGTVSMYTKEKLYDILRQYKGTMDEFLEEIVEMHHYNAPLY